MLVDKDRIVAHLHKLYTNGQVPEAIVTGAFSAAAVSPDQQLIVVVPGLDKVEALGSEPIGIVDLDLFIKSLKSLSGDGGDIGVVYEGNRLKAEQRHGGRMSFATASPTTIGTRISEDSLSKAKAFIEKGTAVPLDQTTVQGVLETTKLLKADEIMVRVKEGGGHIFVGAEVSHNATFDMPKLVPQDGQDDYTLPVSASVLIDVLQQVSDYTQAQLVLTGPDSLLAIREGEYMYIVSPKAA